jgi:hypothetical protein
MIFCNIFTITNTKIVISGGSDGLPSKKESRTSIRIHKPILHSITKYSFNTHTHTRARARVHRPTYIHVERKRETEKCVQ